VDELSSKKCEKQRTSIQLPKQTFNWKDISNNKNYEMEQIFGTKIRISIKQKGGMLSSVISIIY
jgi:hypothetical protein